MRKISCGDSVRVSKGDRFILVIGDKEVPAVYAEGGWCQECPLYEKLLEGETCTSWVRSCKVDLADHYIIQIEDAVE